MNQQYLFYPALSNNTENEMVRSFKLLKIIGDVT